MSGVTFPALKALAALLSYPQEGLRQALAEVGEVLEAERRFGRREREALQNLVQMIQDDDLLDAQERYVALFDRGRATSLNLYEHVHGDSRDRGQAMIDLMSIYERGGLSLSTRELPDHLPVLLEYLSTRPFGEVRDMLSDCSHLVRAIGNALVERSSPYAAAFAALLEFIGEKGLDAQPRASTRRDDDKALDDEWVEAPVLFGLGCGDARDGGAAAKPVHFVRKAV